MRELTGEDVKALLKGKLNQYDVEKDLKLLGITAVEDLLQEDVKECINEY